ncbi:bifunctional diaminohydroxyphosphoribosylaminopyrimidine deaminase/5-amino-6-(5-phosphoribosylamino)uracil reductase RibD [Avibacterium sp. 20-129]|uniref:bifunctional diaminohydroxyphosphoribosylaminopyrimidine deaminase/5-amino-6-(5-phosphoribosylamino)uracil reductase RibD n=1 Tax=Avibacterium sp. 20-129 TaxID=2911525 RepID=UPI0022458532|nr:bifunctional diaminohydroxyphosphoribosylaminopyrimidine deaminase/5-amino-6-(5-phosphoribosylamino)uracil reductase RibD [Avibacterium sp. 20-129]MCW9698352.1 bifunctional diaminohydroxyphosphoribosylaminopyrimidine deaminase/5-amino-6-(5-phosphoribosylamino)uracil reductase RibD [Avibacterium sp. 20-129]
MQPFSQQDQQFMQMALDLAKQGRFTTTPNPSVGCVLVKEGKVIGKGFHLKAGQPHAEVMALREAGENARGTTAYVTLEPCSHFGRTPPCAKGLIEAGVIKVIAAMTDPNPQVAGRGLKMLEQAGVQTEVGLLAEQAALLNQGFLTRMCRNRPFVQLKMAMSIDGRTAMASGESKWITGALARQDVQQYRAAASAILSTSQTVLMDNPMLNVRWEQLPLAIQQQYPDSELRQPVRVILDSQHRVTPEYQLFQQPTPVWLVSSTARDMQGMPDFCQAIHIEKKADFFTALLTQLAEQQINTLWVEAGAQLAGALIEAKLVDELIIYLAPKLLGDKGKGLCQLPHLQKLADAPQWQLQSATPIGEDLKLIYHPKN